MCMTIRVGGPTRVNQVLGGPGKKLSHIDICKKISTQPNSNPWWARLAHGFWLTLTGLVYHYGFCSVIISLLCVPHSCCTHLYSFTFCTHGFNISWTIVSSLIWDSC